MTNIEKDLLTLIRENKNPEQALVTAILIIASVLEQSLSSPAPSAVAPLERA